MGADKLDISEKTFRTHVADILAEARRRREIFPAGTEVTRDVVLVLTYCQNNPVELRVPF
jgi:hypothetical protein